MSRLRDSNAKKSMAKRNAMVSPRRFRHGSALSQRTRGAEKSQRNQFVPPEDWYEPSEAKRPDYRIVVQQPGPGYRHVVTPDEVRWRLSQVPPSMLEGLEVIQLSRMTRKKQSFPCYGMQWGSTVYLYPIEDTLIEFYGRPPAPAQRNEAHMYGGRWVQSGCEWKLVWTEESLRDFYLNNILIHELGHLLDDRNSSYTDRERFAEWFAIEHGYKRSQPRFQKSRPSRKRISRRHHAV